MALPYWHIVLVFEQCPYHRCLEYHTLVDHKCLSMANLVHYNFTGYIILKIYFHKIFHGYFHKIKMHGWNLNPKNLNHRKWDGWAHKPGLTNQSLVHRPRPSGMLCALFIANSTFTKLINCWHVDFTLMVFLILDFITWLIFTGFTHYTLVTTITDLYSLTI